MVQFCMQKFLARSSAIMFFFFFFFFFLLLLFCVLQKLGKGNTHTGFELRTSILDYWANPTNMPLGFSFFFFFFGVGWLWFKGKGANCNFIAYQGKKKRE